MSSSTDDRFLPAGTLGEGSYGSVFKVFRESDGEGFAAKSFTSNEGDGTLEAGTVRELSVLVALRRERELAGKPPHPNVMPVVAVTTIEGIDGFCMVMPSLPMSLTTAISAKALNRESKVRVGLGLLRALEFLHANSVIHRDVKPDNVLLTADLTPLLADFSLAKILGASRAADTRAGKHGNQKRAAAGEGGAPHTAGMGTATYMAPEVVSGSSYACAADMWSVGVVLYETVQGELLAASKDKAAFRLLDDVRARLSADKPLPALLRKLIAVDASERITAADAVVEMLAVRRAMPGAEADAGAEEEEGGPALGYFQRWAAGVLPQPSGPAPAGKGGIAAAATHKRRRVDGAAGKRTDADSLVLRCCTALDTQNPLTPLLAIDVARRTGAQPMHCAVLCSKLLEVELNDLVDLEEREEEDDGIAFELEEYLAAELAMVQSLGYSLYVPAERVAVHEA